MKRKNSWPISIHWNGLNYDIGQKQWPYAPLTTSVRDMSEQTTLMSVMILNHDNHKSSTSGAGSALGTDAGRRLVTDHDVVSRVKLVSHEHQGKFNPMTLLALATKHCLFTKIITIIAITFWQGKKRTEHAISFRVTTDSFLEKGFEDVNSFTCLNLGMSELGALFSFLFEIWRPVYGSTYIPVLGFCDIFPWYQSRWLPSLAS